MPWSAPVTLPVPALSVYGHFPPKDVVKEGCNVWVSPLLFLIFFKCAKLI